MSVWNFEYHLRIERKRISRLEQKITKNKWIRVPTRWCCRTGRPTAAGTPLTFIGFWVEIGRTYECSWERTERIEEEEREMLCGNERKWAYSPYILPFEPVRFSWTDPGLNRPSPYTKAQYVFCTHSAHFLFIHFLHPWLLTAPPFFTILFYFSSFMHFFFLAFFIVSSLKFTGLECIFIIHFFILFNL